MERAKAVRKMPYLHRIRSSSFPKVQQNYIVMNLTCMARQDTYHFDIQVKAGDYCMCYTKDWGGGIRDQVHSLDTGRSGVAPSV